MGSATIVLVKERSPRYTNLKVIPRELQEGERISVHQDIYGCDTSNLPGFLDRYGKAEAEATSFGGSSLFVVQIVSGSIEDYHILRRRVLRRLGFCIYGDGSRNLVEQMFRRALSFPPGWRRFWALIRMISAKSVE